MEICFDPRNDLLALDMDGVIIDSINECLLNGYNAYARFRSRPPATSFRELPPGWTAAAARIRRFIRNGEDYVYIAHAIDLGAVVDNQADFDAFVKKHAELRSRFAELIFQQRLLFSDQTPHLWGELNPFYPGMKEFLLRFPAKENLCIITSKKRVFAEKILAAHGVDFAMENLRTGDAAGKRDIIEKLCGERLAVCDRFFYIDDQVDTLLKIKPAGVRLYLAAWGYNNEEQRQTARENGLPVLNLEAFYRLFGSTT